MAFWNFSNKKEDEQTITITPKLVGPDLGYGQVKNYDGYRYTKFISAVGVPVSDFARVAAVVSEEELLESLAVTYEGKKTYVGHNAVVNSRNGRLTLRQNKAESDHNKIKFITSLALYMDEDQEYAEFNIVTGLPVLEFANQKDKLYSMMMNFGRPFEFVMHYGPKEVKKIVKINEVRVISQGEGAFYDYVLDTKGQIIPERAGLVTGQVMVVDPGYRTTDIVTMENGRYIEPMSDQFNKGVNQIHQEILRLIMERLNIKKELKDMDEIVRTGKLFHNRKEYNVIKIIEDAARPYAADIVDNLITVTNDTLGSMQRVILTGGGAEIIYPYVKEELEDVIEVELMENAEFCNSSGYYKYGLLLETQGGF